MRSRNRWTLVAALLVTGLIVSWIALLRERARTTALSTSASVATASELDAAETASRREATDPSAPPSRPQTRIRVVAFGTSAPIPGASIRIEPAHSDDVQRVTDDQGLAHCDTDLLEESWLEIQAEHYTSVRNPIPLRPTGDLEFTLFGTGDLLVHVRDELGGPMPQAILLPELIDTHLSQAQHDAIVAGWPDWFSPKTKPWTDDLGDRRIDDLPRGCKLSVTALNSRVEVTLDSTTPLTEVTIVVPMNRCIRGRLVWEDKTPVTDRLGIESFVIGDPNGSWTRTSSDLEGRFELCRLPPGRVNWKVMYTGESVRCLPAAFGEIDPVKKLGVVDVGDIVLHRALVCTGRVRFSDVPSDYDYWNVQLHVWQRGVPLGINGSLAHDGTFKLMIPPGPATLCVVMGWKPVTSVAVVSPFDGLVIDLDPFAGRLRIDNMPVPHGTDLEVLLHDEPAAWSIRNREGERSRRAFMNISDADVKWCAGSLCIKDVAPGETDVFATDKKDVWFLGHVLVLAGKETVIDAGLVQPGAIRVLAHDSDGKPVEGYGIEASLSAGLTAQLPTKRVMTGADGKAVITGIAAGRWIVFPRGHGELADDAQVVDVTSGATSSIEIVTVDPGSVTGRVSFGDAPAPGIGVWASFRGPGTNSWHGSLPTVTTDEQGKYRLDRVLPGRYCLSFWRGSEGRPPLQRRTRFVDVHAGETAVCDVDLDSSCRRLVFQRDGQPWNGVDAGEVYTPDGSSSIEARPEFEGGFGASIRAGPCLFVLKSKDVVLRDNFSEQEVFYVPVYAIDSSQAPIVVDLRGGRIDVHLEGEGAWFPVTHVGSIDGIPFNDGFRGWDWSGWSPRCAHEDVGAVRSFTHLPVGSTVELVSERNLPGKKSRLELRIVSEATIDVTWPPH